MEWVDKETGTKFSDVTGISRGTDADFYAAVCADCASSHHLLDSYLDVSGGSGPCQVEGCTNQAVHTYDFALKG